MTRAKDERLHDEGDHQEEAAFPEAIADERRTGDRHGTEQALLPESSLQRVGDGRQPRNVGGENIRVEQRL